MVKKIIIGDIFKDIANHDIICYSDVIKMIEFMIQDSEMEFIIGQGISEDQVKLLENKIEQYNLQIVIKTDFNEVVRCKNNLTHKHKTFNTLISDPVYVGESEYRSVLLVDERCAELSDHVTGKHLQFMVLLESARQMVNAVSEKIFSGGNKLFLASNLLTSFLGFVYPFGTQMVYKILDKKVKVGNNGTMQVEIQFIQHDEVKCILKMDFTILDKKLVTTIEDSALSKLCGAMM